MDDKNVYHVDLINNNGKSWCHGEGFYVKGFAFYGNVLLRDMDLGIHIFRAIEKEKLNDVLLKLNGNFSAIIKFDSKLYLISDKIRSYPIIFGLSTEGKWLISDNGNLFIKNKTNLRWDDISIAEFYAMGFVSGNNTLITGVSTVDCGEYVILDITGNQFRVQYFEYICPKIKFNKEQHLISAYKSLEEAFKRTIESIDVDNQIIIPLSGGYDSRLIACLCKKFKLKNVLCYTYGRNNSFEVSTSNEVAKVLGFKWYFVEYTSNDFENAIKSELFIKFSDFSGNLNSIPHVQEFMAIKKLKEEGIIREGAVVIPGFCGDVFGGSKVPHEVYEWSLGDFNIKKIVDLIYHHFYDLNELYPEWQNKVRKRISNEFNELDIRDEDNLLNNYEQWCINNRLAKYIINSLRVYEFFGMDWRMPLWDDKYALIWYQLPWRDKSPAILSEFMFNNYFIRYGVDYKKADVIMSERKIVRLMKKLFPSSLRLFIRKAYVFATSVKGRRDENCFKATAETLSETFDDHSYWGMVKSWKKSKIMAVVARLEILRFTGQ